MPNEITLIRQEIVLTGIKKSILEENKLSINNSMAKHLNINKDDIEIIEIQNIDLFSDLFSDDEEDEEEDEKEDEKEVTNIIFKINNNNKKEEKKILKKIELKEIEDNIINIISNETNTKKESIKIIKIKKPIITKQKSEHISLLMIIYYYYNKNKLLINLYLIFNIISIIILLTKKDKVSSLEIVIAIIFSPFYVLYQSLIYTNFIKKRKTSWG